MSGSGIPELSNPIIALGNQVVFGVLLPDQAIRLITEDGKLTSASDSDIEHFITEADGYWREHLDSAIERPQNVAIYPAIAAALTEQRLKRIGVFRKGAAEKDKPAFDARMAHWIGVTARTLLAVGMTRLLFSDGRTLQAAYDAFVKANWLARALPDDGQLRLREVIWATSGRRIAALCGGQRSLVEAAEEELAGLLRLPGREAEAKEYLTGIYQDFGTLQAVILRRKPPSSGGAPDEMPAADHQGIPADLSPPVTPPPPESQPTEYAIYYQDLLNWFGGLANAGRLSIEEASSRLAETVDLSRLEPRYIYFISEFHRNLATNAPDKAKILGELNYAIATRLTGKLAEMTRGYCAYAVGTAYVAEARRARPDNPERYRAPLPWLEEALRLLDVGDQDDVAAVHCGAIIALLGLCYRGVRDFVKARDFALEAIRRHEALPATPFHKANLGAAYGNLADAEEQLGEKAAARQNYFHAFEHFAGARDAERLRRALTDYARLCTELGRFDDAQAALERAATLLTELADALGAVRCHLALAEGAFATRQFEQAVEHLHRSQALLAVGPPESEQEREYTELSVQTYVWEGYLRSLIAMSSGNPEDADQAMAVLEQARVMAGELNPDHLGTVLLLMATLLSKMNRLEEAETYCEMLDNLPVKPVYLSRRQDVLADIRQRQGRHAEAVNFLLSSVGEHRDAAARSDRRAALLHRLGETYEAMKDPLSAATAYEDALAAFERHRGGLYEASRLAVMGHVEETYERVIALRADPTNPAFDPIRALDWLERSKSRVFVEVLGLSRVQPHSTPDAVPKDLEEEARYLARLSQLRTTLFLKLGGGTERLSMQQELSVTLNQLEAVWRRIAAWSPEYDEIRRGTTLDWADYHDLLAQIM